MNSEAGAHFDVHPPTSGTEVTSSISSPGSIIVRAPETRLLLGLLFAPATCVLTSIRPSAERVEHALSAPRFFIVPAGVRYEVRCRTAAEFLFIAPSAELAPRFGCNSATEITIVSASAHDPLFWTFASVLRHLRQTGAAPGALSELVIQSLIHQGEKLLLDPAPSPVRTRRLTTEESQRVLDFMSANLKYDIHVDDLARQTGHSVAHFTELFTNATGRSPFRFMKELRMTKAHGLLMKGGLGWREVAVQVGYSNAEHFAEVFRKHWGCSVREFARSRWATTDRLGRSVNRREIF